MKEGGLFMEQQAMIAMALSLAAGLATGIGGLVVCFLKVPTRRLLSIGLGFSGGVMVAVSLMDLLPEAFSACMVPMGKVVGGFYAIVVKGVVARRNHYPAVETVGPRYIRYRSRGRNVHYMRVGARCG